MLVSPVLKNWSPEIDVIGAVELMLGRAMREPVTTMAPAAASVSASSAP